MDHGISQVDETGLISGVSVDSLGRSNTFKVHSCTRPWFRAFHFSWSSFFLAFIGWFALVPAIEYMVEDPSNDIDFDVAKTSSIVSVSGTVFVRLAIGPLCERFGPKRLQCFLLVFGGICVLASAAVVSKTGLLVSRFFIGFIGGAFVPCQYWTTMMFADDVVGQANAFAGGWGNLGGGVANVLVAALIEAGQNAGLDNDTAWRVSQLLPGLLLMVLPVFMYAYSDDCPQGNWSKRKYNNQKREAEKVGGLARGNWFSDGSGKLSVLFV